MVPQKMTRVELELKIQKLQIQKKIKEDEKDSASIATKVKK